MSRESVLVLCTGNSCRSQMAEGYLRVLGGGTLRVASAGTRPAAEVHPLARRVMLEDGVDLAGHRPRDISELRGRPVDHLIIVCDGAARDCPTGWPGVGERIVWPFDDPALFEGTGEERLAGFRRVRNEIRARVTAWLREGARDPSSAGPDAAAV
ncbi:MAG: arsenate reductase ArsC [Thermoanaerobaculia bacterium]|nr:arsenate reductase ArsC [Thermoanaerobaculia bacterium]